MYINGQFIQYPTQEQFNYELSKALKTIQEQRVAQSNYVSRKNHIIGCVVRNKKHNKAYMDLTIKSIVYGSGFSGLCGWYSHYNSYFNVNVIDDLGNESTISVDDLVFYDEDLNELTYSQYTSKYWFIPQLTASFN